MPGDGLRFGCLIDSPRASAALIATLTPRCAHRLDCSLHLFPRVPLADAGIAPLTSMFQHNDMGPARIDDFRPAVHDSDVLASTMARANGCGAPWPTRPACRCRPLPGRPARVRAGPDADRFARFRDQEGAYHRRPSAWVTPRGDWGAGAVMLLEIPTANEFADNIVAFWRPDQVLAPGRTASTTGWTSPRPARRPCPPARAVLARAQRLGDRAEYRHRAPVRDRLQRARPRAGHAADARSTSPGPHQGRVSARRFTRWQSGPELARKFQSSRPAPGRMSELRLRLRRAMARRWHRSGCTAGPAPRTEASDATGLCHTGRPRRAHRRHALRPAGRRRAARSGP